MKNSVILSIRVLTLGVTVAEVDRSDTVHVEDGVFDMEFITQTENPMISAIEIQWHD